jgi:hypothetical protein
MYLDFIALKVAKNDLYDDELSVPGLLFPRCMWTARMNVDVPSYVKMCEAILPPGKIIFNIPLKARLQPCLSYSGITPADEAIKISPQKYREIFTAILISAAFPIREGHDKWESHADFVP